MSEVDKVGVVWQDLCGCVAQSLAFGLESLDVCGREGGSEPLALVLREERKGACSYLVGIAGGVLNSTRCRNVCSEVFPIVWLVFLVRFLILDTNIAISD